MKQNDKHRTKGRLPVLILLRAAAGNASELARISSAERALEIAPSAPMLLGVDQSHSITVQFGEVHPQEETAALPEGNSRNPISMVHASSESTARQYPIDRRPYKVVDAMKPFWEERGWVVTDESGKVVAYCWPDFNEPGAPAAATRYMIDKVLKIDPRQVLYDQFNENSIAGALNHYNGRVYTAVSEAYPDIRPWDMHSTPRNYFTVREHRTAAIKEMVTSTGKDLVEITRTDFVNFGLHKLLDHRHYSGSIYRALKEAYPNAELSSPPLRRPRISDEERRQLIKKVVDEVGREGRLPRDITVSDFRSRHATIALNKFGDSPYEALKWAGYVTDREIVYMTGRGHPGKKKQNGGG